MFTIYVTKQMIAFYLECHERTAINLYTDLIYMFRVHIFS